MNSAIQSFAHVMAACNGVEQSLQNVLANPDDYASPEWYTVAGRCRLIWDDLTNILSFIGWQNIPGPPATTALQWSDFEYLGAIKLPPNGPVSRGYDFLDDSDIAYDGMGGLLVKAVGGVVRLVPASLTFTNSKDPNDLGTAIESAVDGIFNGGTHVRPLTTIRTNYNLGAIAVDGNGFLWCGSYEYYNTAGRDHTSITAHEWINGGLDGPTNYGAWALGPFGAQWQRNEVPVPQGGWYDPANLKKFDENKTTINNMGGALCRIPKHVMLDWFNIDNEGILTGGQRGEGAFGGGQGPCLYAFEANHLAVGDLQGKPLAVFFFNSGQWSGYKADDTFETVFVWTKDGRSCLITGGRKGMGPQYYGPGTNCDPDKGYHSNPYEPRIWVWNSDDFRSVAQGSKEPWEIQPVEEAGFPEAWLYDGQPVECRWPWFEGLTWDWDNEVLYGLQTKAYDPSGGTSYRMGSIIHAWGLKA